MKKLYIAMLWCGLALIPISGYASWHISYEKIGPIAAEILIE